MVWIIQKCKEIFFHPLVSSSKELNKSSFKYPLKSSFKIPLQKSVWPLFHEVGWWPLIHRWWPIRFWRRPRAQTLLIPFLYLSCQLKFNWCFSIHMIQFNFLFWHKLIFEIRFFETKAILKSSRLPPSMIPELNLIYD